ncbi:MAG: caspase family protein [Candidatus Electrothrix aestuarii]|uniref:Caspase family protein n=1 Tax=Candidatus Electrothrix aestuarii TaxID=3062594 RepID=A0AAU8M1A2_9BACT|nr:caspase family protein [Candidatus Electrothrix aestuarii]
MIKKNILFVDDEKATLKELQEVFSDEFNVYTACSVIEAEEKLRKSFGDNYRDLFCIFIDLKLDSRSEFSGVELVKIIKLLRIEKPHIHYFVLSAYSPSGPAREAFQKVLWLGDDELECFEKEHYISKKKGNYFKNIQNKLNELCQPKYDFGEYFGIFIPVEKYTDPMIDNLTKPVKDAKKLQELLERRYRFRCEVVENPTRKNILDFIDNLKGKISAHTNLMIFFAGHAEWIEEQKQGYWFPCDAVHDSYSNKISAAEIKSHLRPLPAKHILLIIDACYSWSFKISRDNSRNKGIACKEYHKNPSRKVLTSCANQKTPDESYFLKHLIKILEKNVSPLSTSSLFDDLRDKVVNEKWPEALRPHFFDIYNSSDDADCLYQEGDFIFAPNN